MAARARKHGESFEDYRKNLINEERETRARLKGTLVYLSAKPVDILNPEAIDGDGKFIPGMPETIRVVRRYPPARVHARLTRDPETGDIGPYKDLTVRPHDRYYNAEA